MLHRIRPRRVGCGIAVSGADLIAVAVRLHPEGVEVLGQTELRGFRERPPDEWGAEYSVFLRGLDLGQTEAAFCIPRDEVIFRVLGMPPMRSKDISRAVALQVDELHPYGETEVVHASTPLDGGSRRAGPRPVAVAVARADRVRLYAHAFANAGIALARCTVSAGALRAAVRRDSAVSRGPVALALRSGWHLEIYGESNRRLCLNSSLDLEGMTVRRALRLSAEALDVGTEETASLAVLGEEGFDGPPAGFAIRDADSVLLPIVSSPDGFSFETHILAFGAAVESARPSSGLGLNLLSPTQRHSRPVALLAPRLVATACLALLGAATLLRPLVQDRSYADRLQRETVLLQDPAEIATSDQADAADLRGHRDWLLGRQDRTRADLELLREIAESLPDSVALTALEIDDSLVMAAGIAEDAGTVLRILSSSALLDGARFMGSPALTDGGERFRIEARRR